MAISSGGTVARRRTRAFPWSVLISFPTAFARRPWRGRGTNVANSFRHDVLEHDPDSCEPTVSLGTTGCSRRHQNTGQSNIYSRILSADDAVCAHAGGRLRRTRGTPATRTSRSAAPRTLTTKTLRDAGTQLTMGGQRITTPPTSEQIKERVESLTGAKPRRILGKRTRPLPRG